jgi:hypothetical protein
MRGAEYMRGERQHRAVLTEKQVLQILQLHQKTVNGRLLGATRIARILNCSERAVDHVLCGNSWVWLTGIKK